MGRYLVSSLTGSPDGRHLPAGWQEALLDLRKRLMKFCLVCRVYLNHQSKVLSEKVSVSLSVLTGRSRGWSSKRRGVRTHVRGKIGPFVLYVMPFPHRTVCLMVTFLLQPCPVV